MSKRVLLLISDTGGGHRAGALAIGAALDEIKTGDPFEWRIEDIGNHCGFPLSQLGPAYSAALRFAPPVYGALFYATNGRRRFRSLVRVCEPLYRERLRDVFLSYRPDVIVSVHPLLNHASSRARADAHLHVPIITVVTDLGRVHESWLSPRVDAVVVPAQEVLQRALERGIPRDRLFRLGHPVHPKFEDVTATKSAIRERLGLPQDATVALLMAGGEGGGKLLPTTLALAKSGMPLHLIVVCGRNAPLQRRIEEIAPSLPTPIMALGFRDDVPELMRASDLLVTKAGPGAIAEASVSELPVVIYDYIPGQERGNLQYVRSNGIGLVALTTPGVVSAVRRIVDNPALREQMCRRQAELAPRGASRRIAELIARTAYAGLPTIAPFAAVS
ncbi:MAG: glycosyltransferase [Vulcanimicrobiaceae bacterium]|jgi:1,2-diacylglycerol 3-beta-galactosyltransferase